MSIRTLYFILIFVLFLCNLNAQVQYPQEVKAYSLSDSTSPVIVFPPTIITSPIAYSSTDYYIYPSNFSQSEMTIALSLSNSDKLLVGANVINPPGTEAWQGYYYSNNAGINWAGNDILPGTTFRTTDPAVAFDLIGNAYYHYLDNGLPFVKKSTNGGINWQSSILIPNISFADKGHITADNTNSQFSNNIYVAFTEFLLESAGGNSILISRSTDSGSSFETPIDISNVINSINSLGVNLAIGSGGEVYAVWAISDNFSPGFFGSDGIGFNKSLDGGETWQTPVRILNIDGSRDWWYDKNPAFPPQPIRMNDFPCIAVDRSGGDWDGTIYMVFGSKGQSPDRADIHFSKSNDGGLNWSTPVRINDDLTSTDQWNTWITVDPYGLINVVFYDSRNDPNNQLTEVWLAQSVDGGETFTNFRVSDIAFIPYPIVGGFIADGYMGDYIGIASSIGKAYSCWMDNRNAGIYQAYVDILDTYQADLLTLANQNNSLDQFAIAHNNGRKLGKDNTGNYHLIFSSGGEIFYHKTTDGGISLLPANRLSDGNGNNNYPTITESNGRLYVTWQRNTGSNNYDIYFAESTNGGLTWENKYVLSSETLSYDPLPTIQSSSNHTIVAFRYNGGIKSLYTLYENPTPGNWITKTIGFTNSNSPTLTTAISGSTTYFPLAIANSSTNHIYYYYFNTTTQNWTSLPNNLSLIVPGGGSHLTPSISNIPGN